MNWDKSGTLPDLPIQTRQRQRPNRIWQHLTAEQQREVLQALLKACRPLTCQPTDQEVWHDPRSER